MSTTPLLPKAMVNPTLSEPVRIDSINENLRQFLINSCGVNPDAVFFSCPQAPHRIYVAFQGSLQVIELNGLNGFHPQPQTNGLVNGKTHGFCGENGGVRGVDKFGNGICSEWHTLSDAERDALQKERRRASAYKTALCQSFKTTGECEYGGMCRFAHGEDELRLPPQAHPKYKTQLCNKFAVFGSCPYGSRCQFIHQRPAEANESRADANAILNRVLISKMEKLNIK